MLNLYEETVRDALEDLDYLEAMAFDEGRGLEGAEDRISAAYRNVRGILLDAMSAASSPPEPKVSIPLIEMPTNPALLGAVVIYTGIGLVMTLVGIIAWIFVG